MINLRHLMWSCSEYAVDPKDYQYANEKDILAFEKRRLSDINYQHVFDLIEKDPKQFTLQHLQQLVAARGFLEVVCNWLQPDQIQDPQIRMRVAFIQHFLSEIWDMINVK